MNNGNIHEMQIQQTSPDGSQEWFCPTCGRHFVLHFLPNFDLELLAEGDQSASHTGGSGGLQMGSASLIQPQRDVESHASRSEQRATGDHDGPENYDGPEDHDDPYLDPWARWLDGKNF